MSELSNALQGKLNSRKSHVKDPAADRQLDLFSSLSDRSVSAPKFARPRSEPEASGGLEMVLPPPGNPPDVSAEVRAALSESGQVRSAEAATPSAEAPSPLRTGVYHRPRRAAPPPAAVAPPPPEPASVARGAALRRIRGWFEGVELDRRLASLVVVLIALVGLIAYWTARPRKAAEPSEAAVRLDEVPPAPEPAPAAPAPPPAAASPVPAAPAVAPAAAAPAADWKIPGTEATREGDAILIRFRDPVFVSADKISVEGWAALKAVAAKLVAQKAGARVVVTGYTDSEPLGKPTAQFKSNADIAAARAKVALEHLAQFARAGAGLTFEARTGEPSQAPYPNDTPQNRRLNRTATVQVIPAP